MQYRILGLAVLTILLLIVISCPALSGSLEDIGLPADAASAMFTLEDIYNRLDSNTSATKRGGAFAEPATGPAATGRTLDEVYEKALPTQLPKTGQTFGYAGSDGDLKKGVAWPDPRFTDNNDGTVTDNLTGLVWLENAFCVALGGNDLINSLANANGMSNGDCGLSDGSSAGDWRLPNIRELMSLLDYSSSSFLLLPSGHPFESVLGEGNDYWTSTQVPNNMAEYYTVCMGNGLVSSAAVSETRHFWAVRDAY